MRRVVVPLVLALTAVPAVAQRVMTPFVVGVWGQGDAIIPFANYDGQRWRNSWPEAVETASAARPLSRIPATWWGRASLQRTWELIEPNGQRRSIRVTGTTLAGLGSSCSINIGLKTNVAPDTYEYGTRLATSRPGVLRSVETLTSESADWDLLVASLPAVYQQHEAAVWKYEAADFRPDLSAPLSLPRLDAAFIVRNDDGDFVYFESSRDFAAQEHVVGRSFIAGWLRRAGTNPRFDLFSVRTAIDDDKSVETLRPLGTVRDGARRFWLGLLSGYASTSLTVVELGTDRVTQRLLVAYGGC